LDGVEWLAVGELADIPHLRGAGLSRSESDLTLLTEDNCVVDPRWADELIAAAAHADVVGGRMGNARRDRAIDCGAFFAEYGFFAGAHTRHGEQLTAANVLYRGSVRSQVAQWMSAGVWENVVHDRLRVAGARLTYAPRAIVRQNLTHDVWRFCVDRYEHGRDYARVRLAEQGGSRLRGLSSTPLLPALLAYRVARVSAPGQWATFLRALPATLTFFSAWAIGEARGYLTGATSREGSSP
jgi:GT2 family glycosyltransferase